jgi:hypothetical protein
MSKNDQRHFPGIAGDDPDAVLATRVEDFRARRSPAPKPRSYPRRQRTPPAREEPTSSIRTSKDFSPGGQLMSMVLRQET